MSSQNTTEPGEYVLDDDISEADFQAASEASEQPRAEDAIDLEALAKEAAEAADITAPDTAEDDADDDLHISDDDVYEEEN